MKPRSTQSADRQMKGLLIIPNFNQGSELSILLPKLTGFYPPEHTLFVDDGSSDNSVHIARQNKLPVIEHGTNRGTGAAIRTGIRYAREQGYDFVCIFSANGKMLPEDIATVLSPLLAGKADYVTGSRFYPGGASPGLPPFRRLVIPLYSWFSTLFLRRHFTDITCGFRAYRLSLLESTGMDLDQAWLDGYELEYYLHYYCVRKKGRIVEVPVTISYSHLPGHRQTKIVPWVHWWRILRPFILLSLGIKR